MSEVKVVKRRARDIEVGDIVRLAATPRRPAPTWFEVEKVEYTERDRMVRLWRHPVTAVKVPPLELVEVQVDV